MRSYYFPRLISVYSCVHQRDLKRALVFAAVIGHFMAKSEDEAKRARADARAKEREERQGRKPKTDPRRRFELVYRWEPLACAGSPSGLLSEAWCWSLRTALLGDLPLGTAVVPVAPCAAWRHDVRLWRGRCV